MLIFCEFNSIQNDSGLVAFGQTLLQPILKPRCFLSESIRFYRFTEIIDRCLSINRRADRGFVLLTAAMGEK
jgi:hypothetical protein